MSVTGVVIAGGKSSRMGQDKALLEVGGRSQLERCQQLLREVGCIQTLISRNEMGFIVDEYPAAGPLGGLLSAAKHAEGNRLLVIPVDMPLLTAGTLGFLLEREAPVYFRASALPCVLNNDTRLISYLSTQLSAPDGNRSVRGLLMAMNAHALDWPYSYQLQNTNTPKQWQHALTLLGE